MSTAFQWPRNSSWTRVLADEFEQPYFEELQQFVADQRRQFEVFPSAENVFRAFELSSFEETRVVILGQDPYHGPGQADGLSFSVPAGVRPPPSLRNIFGELQQDLNAQPPRSGNLEFWARQGVLMLNTVLTVRAGEPFSHRQRGWERFTERVIRELGCRTAPVAFVLWGRPARTRKKLIDLSTHTVVESAHPSPLSASRGFFGSRPFSRINFFLESKNKPPIDWTQTKTSP